MKRLKLSTQLSAGFAMIALVVIGLVSVSANFLIRSQFEIYMQNEQERFAEELAENLSNQYHHASHSWNIDYIHGVGMYAVNDGYFLKILDTNHRTIWDIQQHDMQCCSEMMEQIQATMERLNHAGGQFVSHEYPLYQNQQEIGYAEIMYYTPYYMNENAFQFLDSLNLILTIIGIVSIVGAVLIGMLFAKRITAPIPHLISRMKSISEGNYSANFDETANSAELAELSKAVTVMAQTLEQQEKLRQRLTGDVAHELRTPLTNVASHLEMMCEGIWQPEPARLESCYEEIRRISGLVDDMEKLHRIDTDQLILHKTTFPFRQLLENVSQLFEKEMIEKQISIDIQCDEISICADRDRITQVVTNLLSNAVKYSNHGGKIHIQAQKTEQFFQLRTCDTGIGISPDDLPHIFERFYRADKARNRSTGGSGIGLAVTKAIIEAHHGQISVTSEFGKGSEFILTLPSEK